ncbi:MAG: hypothetical protein JSS49_30490 [Planctomycetes bacterium]|nr:hypothetical protein [Planctomycetota bacterium]
MADSFVTLADLVKLNDQNLADIDVTDLLQGAPFLAALAAVIASNGTNHSYLKETAAPVVGFRAVNAGRFNSTDTDTKVEIALQILDASFTVDKALADAYAKGGAPAYLSRRGRRALRAAFAGAEAQLFYGTGADADGFVGMAQAATVDALADTDHVVNAGGATVGGASSVWAVHTADDDSGVCVVTGQDGQIKIDDSVVIKAQDGAGKSYPAYFTPIEGWLGLQVGSAYDMARIVNLTTEDGHGLDDDLLSQLVELFPSDKPPTMIVMNRRSRGQLQRSRTATTATGATAPMPKDYDGIPIICTDQLSKTEALVA